jgi:hypothetical protein
MNGISDPPNEFEWFLLHQNLRRASTNNLRNGSAGHSMSFSAELEEIGL